MNNWADQSTFYHIYPLGFCGAEPQNDFTSAPSDRILKVLDWCEHIWKTGFSAIYFGPVFESNAHGYDTVDYTKVDRRLGTNADFAKVCQALRDKQIRIVVDGVFNHVGRDFWAFKDVREKRWDSPYKDWFQINFDGNSNYNDGFWYEGWEGHYELVKLNLRHPDVKQHIFSAVEGWVKEFDIDGIRLDVAYCLDKDFLRELSSFCQTLKPDFWLLGEMLHGDYKTCVNSEMVQSATNYECYKGLYSSMNSNNMFEIAHSIKRQFGQENWCLYKGLHLYNFVDNHDVSRIATILSNQQHLPLVYALMYTMPGIPSVYYGSEWGVPGDKHRGDQDLRPSLSLQDNTALTVFIKQLNSVYRKTEALYNGDYVELSLTNHQYVFQRQTSSERLIIAINIHSDQHTAHFNANCGCGIDLLTDSNVDFGGGLDMPGYSAQIIRCER